MQKRSFYKKNNRKSQRTNAPRESAPSAVVKSGTFEISEIITVKDLSEITKIPITELISSLIKNGVLATINDSIDFETAEIICDDFEVKLTQKTAQQEEKGKKTTETKKNLTLRPPVVTIMGHVDHGKTSLLDRIRQEHVADSESGGITQHISAYQITLKNTKKAELKNHTITFIDTPGHAAFSAMRGHGAAITDIVVLIVAANDGVMPQTIEVIEQAKLNNVPVIVAINKIDLPDADPMRVKQMLSEHELIPEDWGGKTVMVPISAKTGEGVEDLLEIILIQAEMMDLKADPSDSAVGVVIESHMHKGAGALAVVLVENGTLKRSDPIQIGGTYGKVRIMENFLGEPIESAQPSTPVRIAGLKAMPDFGDRLIVFKNEKEARESAEKVTKKSIVKIATAKKISEDENDASPKDKELRLIIKADVGGSLEAVKKLLSEIDPQELGLKLISEGIGAISESDITLAHATSAHVIGFRVSTLVAAQKIAEKDHVIAKTFDVIYELIDYVKETLSQMLPPEIIVEELGKGDVLAIFRDDKKGFVFGGKLKSGKIAKGEDIKIFQNENEKWQGKILSLRREKNEANEIEAINDLGVGLTSNAKVAVGDTFLVYNIIQKKRTIK